jgi:hypothetical protein
MIHQELNLMPHLTVAQNIFIGREPRRQFRFVLDEREIGGRTTQDVITPGIDGESQSGGSIHTHEGGFFLGPERRSALVMEKYAGNRKSASGT